MASELFLTPARATSNSGSPLSGAVWYYYQTGTLTPQTVYADVGLTVPLGTTVTSDGAGRFVPIYLDSNKTYRAILKTSDGVDILDEIDPVTFGSIDSSTSIDVGSFGTLDPTGATDNTSIFATAYAAAQATNKNLRLPPGTFKVSGLTWAEDGPSVYGAGTTFIPAANSQAFVIYIEGGAPYTRTQSPEFCNFAINLTGFTGCTGLKTSYLVIADVHHIHIRAYEYPAMAGGNIGWRSIADQYSAFSHFDIERVTYGAYITSDVVAGGGINNTLRNFRIAYCKVGMMQINVSPYPMGIVTMDQCVIQVTTHCAFYAYNVQQLRVIGMPPEDCSGSGTITVDGYTIKAGHIHANQDCQITFQDYNHSTNDATMVIRAENNTHLRFEGSSGGAINTYCDRTSTIEWDGTWGNNSHFRYTELTGRKIQNGRTVVATMYPNMVIDGSFPTGMDVGTAPVSTFSSAGLAAGPTVNGDNGLIAYTSATFGAGVGAIGSHYVAVNLTSGSSVDKTKGNGAAILLRSSIDADYTVYFSNIVQNATITLRAGEWTRVVMFESNGTGTINGYFYLLPVASGGPTLDWAYPTLLRDPSATNIARFLREHVVNPRNAKGLVYEAAAAPTTGTWPRGAVVWNNAPTAGGVPGWECVTAGTPGTWKAMATLAA